MTQEEKSQQIKDIIINFSTSTKYTLDDAIDDIMALMEKYGKQCYIQGSNDCHKSLYNAYNELIETIKNRLQP